MESIKKLRVSVDPNKKITNVIEENEKLKDEVDEAFK